MFASIKRVGIVGLGLIGGSLAKAYKRDADITVLGADLDSSIVEFAKLAEAIDGELTDAELRECDCILLAIYPKGVVDWVKAKCTALAGSGAVVIDCAGTKSRVCSTLFPLAAEHGFTFVGGHPMAGMHRSGFKYSREDLFDGEPMVIVPPKFDEIEFFERIKALLAPVGFGRFSVTTAEEHDRIIAFASQMPHMISNAFIKSPTAARHKGYSAGSYRDLSRVARLDADMWSELFLDNQEYLLSEFDKFMMGMNEYRAALVEGNAVELRRLLDEGSRRKLEVDGP